MSEYLSKIKSTIDTYIAYYKHNENLNKYYSSNIPEGEDPYTWKYCEITGVKLGKTLDSIFEDADEEQHEYIYSSLYARFPRGAAYMDDIDDDNDIDNEDAKKQVPVEEV